MTKSIQVFLVLALLLAGFRTQAKIGDLLKSDKKTAAILEKRSFIELDPFANMEMEMESQSFFMEGIYEEASVEDEQTRLKIDAALAEVTEANRFVKFLDESALIELPVGIKKTIGSLEYIIIIDSVISTAGHTMLSASMSFETPKMGKIHFRAEGIKFSKKGGVSGGTLFLVGDYPSVTKVDSEKEKTQFVIRGSGNKTYVEFDCAGFKQFSLDGSVVFSNKTIQPEDATGKVIENKNVSVDFSTLVTDWNDILIEISIDPFQVKGLKDVSFAVTRAVIDLSDTKNSPGVIFPSEYISQSEYHKSGTPELWRGVFISNLTISLPHQFDTTTTVDPNIDSRIKLIGRNMLIDDMGFTGIISGQNLIPLEKGKIGKWKFALDDISIKIVVNELKEGSLTGKIDIPIRKGSSEAGAVDDSKLFAYTAMIKTGGEYLFNVSMADNLDFDLFNAADVSLLPSSYVEVESKDGKFFPSANLNGTMDIKLGLNSEDGTADTNEKKNVSLESITFEDLYIRSEEPYVSIGHFSLGLSNSGMGGFPIQINEIFGGQENGQVYLGVDLSLQLTGEGDGGGFGAEGAFAIYTDIDYSTDKVKYKYDRIEIQKLGIDISSGEAFSFKGQLIFYKNDPVYGNGISGSVAAKFSEIGLTAKAVFGSVEGTRYWYVDAIVDLKPGIPIFTGFSITRFGGGAYYHMSIDNKGVGSEIGASSSGVAYVPDKSAGLGLKAIVGVAGADPKVFFAEVTFEMAFRSSGGLKYIRFMGKVSMLSLPIEVPEAVLQAQAKAMAGQSGTSEMGKNASAATAIVGDDAGDASIFGVIIIELNFDDKSLSANLDISINVAGGVIEGGGNVVMFFSQSEWYIYVGRPEKENRIYISVMSSLRVDAYFVMGSVVPDSPPPPEEVSRILGDVDLDYMSDLNSLADGAGIGFGFSLSIDTGDKNFLIFYGHFRMGIGFDMMLKDYKDMQCEGRGSLGINGWYANGQAYAYFDGLIGINVKVFGKGKKMDILSITAAVIIQAKLPNPVWMRGIVGGHYDVMGGMIKGECQFEMEIGEECDMVSPQSSSEVLEGLEVIAQLTPQDGGTDVDVLTRPQVVFNYAMNKSYKIVEGDQTIQFRLTAKEMSLKENDQEIKANVTWSDDQMTAVVMSEEFLPGLADVVFTASAVFEEYRDGAWQELKAEDGTSLMETQTISFKTGKRPNYIVPSNVAHSYPLEDMVNYYAEEYPNGFIQLIQTQGYLFEDPDYEARAQFNNGSDSKETAIQYSESKKEVQFSIPKDLQKDKVYALTLVKKPKQTVDIESNITADSISVDLGAGSDNTVKVTSRSAEGNVQGYEEQELFQSFFRVSKYATYKDKAVATFGSGGWRDVIEVDLHRVGTNLSGTEPFSYRELKEVAGAPALITLTADLSNNSWYKNSVLPIMYEDYPVIGSTNIAFKHREAWELGTPPIQAVYIWQYPFDIEMPENAKASGVMNLPAPEGTISYMLAPRMREDYISASNKLTGKYTSTQSATSKEKKFMTGSFPKIEKGDYWVNSSYIIPGRNITTSTHRHKINNPLD